MRKEIEIGKAVNQIKKDEDLKKVAQKLGKIFQERCPEVLYPEMIVDTIVRALVDEERIEEWLKEIQTEEA